jgi:hypothetical protein
MKKIPLLEEKHEWKIGDKLRLKLDGTIAEIIKPGMRRPEDRLIPGDLVVKPIKVGDRMISLSFDASPDWLDDNAEYIP